MTLIPALLAIVLFGVLPFGQICSNMLASLLNMPVWVCLVALYASFIAIGSVGLSVARVVCSDGSGREDDWFRFGDARGQRFLMPLLAITAGVMIAGMVMSPIHAASIGCALGAGVLAIAPHWALRRVTWPLDVTTHIPPNVEEEDRQKADHDVDAEATVTRSFSWTFASSLNRDSVERYSLHLPIRKSAAEQFSTCEHPLPANYTPNELALYLPPYVLDGLTSEVEQCAIKLARLARQRSLPYLDFVDFILSFTCGALRYTSDEELYGQLDYWAFPVETLLHQRGDCDDHAILSSAILHTLGVDTILIFVREPCHLAVGVAMKMERSGRWVRYSGRDYYYAEATGEGTWRLGEVPSGYDTAPDNLVPIPLVTA